MQADLKPIGTNSMSGLNGLKLASEYRTGQSSMIDDFYVPCFQRATIYDRAVGFFRSSIFLLINHEIPSFVQAGGKIRLICSPSLTADDIEAIKKGYEDRETVVAKALEKEVAQLTTIEELHDRTEALATLIALGILDVKIALSSNSERKTC